MSFLNYNGQIFPEDSPVFSVNRALNYGDGLFESIRIHQGELLFFQDHIDRMFRGMKALKLEIPDVFSDSFFHREILLLGHQQGTPANARVRLGIFRAGGGLYEPQTNSPNYFIQLMSMDNGYEWTESECEVNVFRDVPKNYSTVSFFKSMSALPYVMASIYRREKDLGDCLLLNSAGSVADAISSNLFWIEKGKIYSPPNSDGGVDGVLRKNLIRVLLRHGFDYREKSVVPRELESADEIFLTNTAWGIKRVSRFGAVSYHSFITREIFNCFLTAID